LDLQNKGEQSKNAIGPFRIKIKTFYPLIPLITYINAQSVNGNYNENVTESPNSIGGHLVMALTEETTSTNLSSSKNGSRTIFLKNYINSKSYLEQTNPK